jgi:hypothetical protein
MPDAVGQLARADHAGGNTTAMLFGGMSRITRAPAPITALSPIFTLPTIRAPGADPHAMADGGGTRRGLEGALVMPAVADRHVGRDHAEAPDDDAVEIPDVHVVPDRRVIVDEDVFLAPVDAPEAGPIATPRVEMPRPARRSQ